MEFDSSAAEMVDSVDEVVLVWLVSRHDLLLAHDSGGFFRDLAERFVEL